MKQEVARILYEEILSNGDIIIGDNRHEQDWNIILPKLGYKRENYTYSCKPMFISEDLVSTNILKIFKKEK